MSLAPIGVFDSGVGGLSVLNALCAELPGERFVYFADSAHAPYGERGDEFVAQRSLAVARHLLATRAIKALVVACNTATAAAIQALRSEHPVLPLIGIEPALKPAAALSRTGVAAVFATRGTVLSGKFAALSASLGDRVRFRIVPCDGLAGAIEHGNGERIVELCRRYVEAAGTFGTADGQIDTLVLGCTHYPLVSATLRTFTGDAVHFIDTGAPVALQTRRMLAQAEALAAGDSRSVRSADPMVELVCSAAPEALDAAARRWLTARPTPARLEQAA